MEDITKDKYNLSKLILIIITLSIIIISGCDWNLFGPSGGGGGPEPFIIPRFFDHPAWHPDGEWIAAEHCDSVDIDGDSVLDKGFAGIWLVNAETGEKQPLISGFGLPAWSPDGRYLALHHRAQIFIVEVVSLEPASVDNNTVQQLTFVGRNFYPVWSPDGKKIAYSKSMSDSLGPAGIWIMCSDDSDNHFVCAGHAPDWSPDGSTFIFRYVDYSDSSLQIWQADTNGMNRKQLTYSQGNNHYTHESFKFSPDGSKIATCSHHRSGPAPTIWIMNSDGTDLHRITPGYDWRLDWSPDGSKIVFLHWDFLRQIPGNGQLWLVNKNGTGLKQLTYFNP